MIRHGARDSPELAKVVHEGGRAIVEHVSAMQEMVDSFARYAKLPPLARRSVEIGELLRQVATLYHGVRPGMVVEATDESGGRELLLDPEQFRQVLTNLLDNAIEASPKGGRVTVGVRWQDEEALITVTDEGAGIDVEDTEVLFQPFYSTKGRGSGMGLAMVQRIVADHGGTIRLEPNQPRGVRAVIRLPGERA
jgi:two-component system, NtrC family, nitrogen regulation sensor histidine kinase NtrY